MSRDPALMRTFRVAKVTTHAPGLVSLYVEQTYPITPGQFVNLWIPGVDERPFSVSDVKDGLVEISVKALGPFSRRLVEVRRHDWLGVRGPFGTGFTAAEHGLLVGGGIGVAPLRFLDRVLAAQGLSRRLLFGVKSAAELIFPAAYAGTAELWSDDGSLGERGLVTQGLERALAAAAPRVIYAAGPEPMLLAVLRLARAHQIPAQLSFERAMKCGFGICGQCCMDGAGLRVCVEGPVLTDLQLHQVTDLGLPRRGPSGRRLGA
ncbi:MAG: dihydroorotate dehydrogenase electron transfer subunit [Deltaproteobacteria bacterium]|nr:dihydroorotate dehydrogenase electron transfer subunit [Deltaproteobacteria bacterium]